MQDEAPDGQPQDVGDGQVQPASDWWPWPGSQEEATGPRDGAPGPDETLILPFPAEPVAEPAPEPAPKPKSAPEPAPEPEPADPGPTVTADAPDVVSIPEWAPGPHVALSTSASVPSALEVLTESKPALEVRNEAIPAVAPKAGSGPVGSIPAAHGRAAWTRVQAYNWRLFLIRFLCAGLAVVLAVALVPGLGFVGWSWGQFTRIAIVFGLLNATVKPLLQFLVLRFIFSTYGIVVVVINALLLLLLGAILEDTFEVYRPVSLLIAGLVVGVLGLVLETLLGATPPVLDRDYKDRNGLT